jgi:hypothetical protein
MPSADYKDSANFMLPRCKAFVGDSKDYDDHHWAGICAGEIRALATLRTAAKEPWRCLNIRPEVTNEQLVEVVIRYVEARPNRLHEPFMSLAIEALFDAWPSKD